MRKAHPGLWPGELKNEIKKVKLLFFTLLGFYIFLVCFKHCIQPCLVFFSWLIMKKERIWSYVKETTPHPPKQPTKNIHLGVATRSSTKWKTHFVEDLVVLMFVLYLCLFFFSCFL